MITIEIQANFLRATQAVAQLSVKAKDGRPMLHGAFIDIHNNTVVATNGHTLTAAPALIGGVWNGTDSLILNLSQAKIPAKSNWAIITVNDEGDDIRLEIPGTSLAPQLLTRIKDFRYVDWKMVVSQLEDRPSPYSAVGLNPDYINVVGKVVGKHHCVGMQFYGRENQATLIKVLWSNEPELVHVVMPCII